MSNNNALPYEIIASKSTLYVAPVGTSFPAIDDLEADFDTAWRKIGTLGAKNYKDDGVTITQGQEIVPFRGLGGTLPRKTFRTTEDIKVKLMLVDMTLEQYRLSVNDNTITTDAPGPGVAGTKKLGMSRGEAVTNYAVLVRLPSPYMANGNAHYEFPLTQQTGSSDITLNRRDPAAVALEFTVLEDPDASTEDEAGGRFIAQTDEAGT